MALCFADRLLTIIATATLTSAAWVVIGSGWLGGDGSGGADKAGEQAGQAAPEHGQDSLATPHPAEAMVGRLTIPVAGVAASQLTNTYDDSRAAGERLHEAIDIMAPAGTVVIAAGPGTLEQLFLSDEGGNTIYIRSGDGRTIHYYAHLQDYAPGLKEGQQVRQGQRLGTVGSSGNADPAAPHLHFAVLRTAPEREWWEPASALNPYPLLGGR